MKFAVTAIVALLTAASSQSVHAQSRSQAADQSDLSALRKQVQSLQDQQRQILEELSALRKLIEARLAPQRASSPSPNILAEPSSGDANARFAIIEYSDFECPYCGQYERETYPRILADYVKSGKLRYVHRDLPLSVHPHAMHAARAARCSGEQGKYWEMYDSLYANQADLSDAAIRTLVQSLGLNAAAFQECLSSGRYTQEIQESTSEAQRLGIKGTPTFFLGTIEPGGTLKVLKAIHGAQPYEVFQSGINDMLVKSRATTAPAEPPRSASEKP